MKFQIEAIRAPYDSHDIHMKNSLPHVFPTLPPRDFPRSPHVNPHMGTRVQKVVGPIWVSHMGPMTTEHVKPTWAPCVLEGEIFFNYNSINFLNSLEVQHLVIT